MKKIKISLRDEHFGSILCQNNIGATKIIKVTFFNYDRTVDEIIRMLHKFSSLDKIAMYDIYHVCQTLGYFLEESHDLELKPDYKLKVNVVKEFIANGTAFGILLYVDLFQTDDNLDISSMYPTSKLHWTYSRGAGKTLANKFLNERSNEFSFSFDKKEEENMIRLLPNPKRVICSGAVTTVIYGDGSKTHVRKMEEDANDYEKAFLLSWLYKTYGKKVVNKKLEEFQKEFNVEEPVKDDPMYTTVKEAAKNVNELIRKMVSKKHLG